MRKALLERPCNAGTQCSHFRVQTYPFGPLPLASVPALEKFKVGQNYTEKPSLGVMSILILETGGKRPERDYRGPWPPPAPLKGQSLTFLRLLALLFPPLDPPSAGCRRQEG